MSASKGSHQSASRSGVVMASHTSRDVVGEVPLEADDAAVGGAFEHAVVAGGEVVGHWDSLLRGDRLGGALEVALERVETAGQLGAVRLEPLVELSQGLGAQAVEPALGVAADLDQAGVAQHLEVPGHAGLVHADGVDELGHRTLAVPHGVEDPPASRFGDHIEDGEVAGHPVNIRYVIYMCNHIFRNALRQDASRRPAGR